MSLQTKLLDFSQASFSNGALLDIDGKIKSEAIKIFNKVVGDGTDQSPTSIANAWYAKREIDGKYYLVAQSGTGNGDIYIYDENFNFLRKLVSAWYSYSWVNIKKNLIVRAISNDGQTNGGWLEFYDLELNLLKQIYYTALGLEDDGVVWAQTSLRFFQMSPDAKYLVAREYFNKTDQLRYGLKIYDISDFMNGITQVYEKEFIESGYNDYTYSVVTDVKCNYAVMVGKEGDSEYLNRLYDWKSGGVIIDTLENDGILFGVNGNNYGVFAGSPSIYTNRGRWGYNSENGDFITSFGSYDQFVIFIRYNYQTDEKEVLSWQWDGRNFPRIGYYAYHSIRWVDISDNYICFLRWLSRNNPDDDDRVFIHNWRQDQTALWQNQSLGGIGTIKQINVKDNSLGTRVWYIRKSGDTNWTQFEPNKYYSNGILSLSATESFDIKVEMGNFYEPVKDQIEIDEISILCDLQLSLPTVDNLRITNETSTIVLEWDSDTPITYQVEHSKSINGKWEVEGIANTTTFSFPIADNDEMFIPHYFRVLGIYNDGFTEPTNVVMAIPNKENNSNFYQVCHRNLLSILQNDTRLSEIKEWLTHEPQKTTIKYPTIGWVEYKGETFNDWIAMGEREVRMRFDIGVLQKFTGKKEGYFNYTDDLIFKIREILYEQNNRSLNDYIYDMEFGETIHFRHKDNHTISLISVELKKRIRR